MSKNQYNKDRNYIVYMHISPIGKKYIGITKRKPEQRWLNGKGYMYNTHFWNAIQQYSWENFEHKILFENLTKEEAEQKEIELISYYDSTDPNNGYNISLGGNCNLCTIGKPIKQYNCDGAFVEEYKSIIEASLQTGVHQNGIAMCCRNELKTAGNYIWRYADDSITDEYIMWCNIQETQFCHGGGDAFVSQYTKDGVFIAAYPSIKEAQRVTGINRNSISAACKGVKEFAGSYIWKYENEIPAEYKENWDNKKHVLQYSKDGVFIAEYNSAEEASMSTGVKKNYIYRCCCGDRKSFGGFIWRYADDEKNEFGKAI